MLGWPETNTGRAHDSSSSCRRFVRHHDERVSARGRTSSQRPAGGREKSLLFVHDAEAETLRGEAIVLGAKHCAIMTTGRGKKPVQVSIRFQPFRMPADVKA